MRSPVFSLSHLWMLIGWSNMWDRPRLVCPIFEFWLAGPICAIAHVYLWGLKVWRGDYVSIRAWSIVMIIIVTDFPDRHFLWKTRRFDQISMKTPYQHENPSKDKPIRWDDCPFWSFLGVMGAKWSDVIKNWHLHVCPCVLLRLQLSSQFRSCKVWTPIFSHYARFFRKSSC